MSATSKPLLSEETSSFLVAFGEEESREPRNHRNGMLSKSRSLTDAMEKNCVPTKRHNGGFSNSNLYPSITAPNSNLENGFTPKRGQTSLFSDSNGAKSGLTNVEWTKTTSEQIKKSPVRNQVSTDIEGYFVNGAVMTQQLEAIQNNGVYHKTSNGVYTTVTPTIRETCLATHVSNNGRSMTHKQWLRHSARQKFFSEKKLLKESDCVDREHAAMNASPLSASSAAQATDLSQHSGPIHREENSKVYPHLIVPHYSLEQRGRGLHDQAAKVRDGFHDDEKKLSLDSFKHSVWGGFPNPAIFSEAQQQSLVHQQTPYESTFYPDVNPPGIVHPQSRHYDVNPIGLLKDSNMIPMVKDEGHHGNMTWEKPPFDRMLGGYKTVRGQCYLKPPPVDLDELSEDERERMRVKRERNRVAAAKCRNRRRELLERLEKEAEQLEREQEVLRENVKKLQAQKRKLGSLLDKHEPACSNKVDPGPAPKPFMDEESGEAPAGE